MVQGEGRGHLTQALACRDILVANGFHIAHVLVGSSMQREIPSFFFEKMDAPTTRFASPNYIRDERDRAIRPLKSIVVNALRIPLYLRQLGCFHRIIQQVRPDLIINFYDIMASLYTVLYRPGIPVVAVGHQFLLLHHLFQTPSERRGMLWLARFWTRLTALGARSVLALSFYPLPAASQKRLQVIPPLIRRDVLECQKTGQGDSVLIYLLNSGYCHDVIAWSRRLPHLSVNCYCEHPPSTVFPPPTLNVSFHPLDGEGFIKALINCRSLIATAGFESLCEAAFLQKPILVIPVENHYDQLINSFDLTSTARLGCSVSMISVVDFLSAPRAPATLVADFRRWALKAPDMVIEKLAAL